MKHSTIALSLLLVAGCGGDSKGGAGAPVTVSADAGKLVPPDAVAVVRVASLASLESKLRELAEQVQPSAVRSVDMTPMLAMTGIDPGRIDRSKAVVLASALGEGMPAPTFVLPIKDIANAPTSAMFGKPAIAGDYAAFALGGRPAAGTATPELAKELPPGDISLRIDLAKVVAKYQPVIDRYLAPEQITGLIQSVGVDEQTAGFFRSMVGGIRDFVAAARGLDVGLGLEDGRLTARVRFATTSAQLPTGADPVALAKGLVPGDHPMLLVGRSGWVKTLMEGMGSEELLAALPEKEREEMQKMLAVNRQTMQHMGDVMAVSGTLFGESGMSMTGLFDAKDANGFMESYRKNLGSQVMETQGIELRAEEPATVGGVAMDRYRMVWDLEKLMAASGQRVDAASEAAFSRLLPKDGLVIAQGAIGNKIVFAAGSETTPASAIAAAKANATELPAAVRDAMGDGKTLLLFGYLDFRPLMRMSADMIRSAGRRAAEVPDGPPVPIWLRVGAEHGAYDLVLQIDVAGIGEITSSMR